MPPHLAVIATHRGRPECLRSCTRPQLISRTQLDASWTRALARDHCCSRDARPREADLSSSCPGPRQNGVTLPFGDPM